MENIDLIKNVLNEELDIDENNLKGEDILEKLGVDSLGWTEILVRLERELNFSIIGDDSVEISSFTINDLNQLIEKSRRINNANYQP
jgi:acyl carrier protein